MTSYESLRSDASRIKSIIVDTMLKKIAYEHFKQDRGTEVHKVLPDKSDEYFFQTENFEALIDPDTREFTNATYKKWSLTTNRISSTPENFDDVADPLYDLWWDTFGDNIHERGHPGEPDIEKDILNKMIESVKDQNKICTADPMFIDLINAIEDKNYIIAAKFLNIDEDPINLLTPGGNHELTELFTQGDIHIIYQDRNIALLKPEYNHEIREKVLNQQRSQLGVVRLQGEQPEMAFVIGVDDTPTGLFVHSVDGTRLNKDQNVDREQIHNVMGFDYNYNHQNVLDYNVGNRVRLQGDLAIEYVDDSISGDNLNQCNLPIDNHLCIINHANVLNGKDQEPVEVETASLANLNIIHDEHENVSVELPAGTHRFYLLPRGLQIQENRPSW